MKAEGTAANRANDRFGGEIIDHTQSAALELKRKGGDLKGTRRIELVRYSSRFTVIGGSDSVEKAAATPEPPVIDIVRSEPDAPADEPGPQASDLAWVYGPRTLHPWSRLRNLLRLPENIKRVVCSPFSS